MDGESSAGPGATYCETCHGELPTLRAAWGDARCRNCSQGDERTPWFIDSPPVPLEDVGDVIGYVITVVNRRFSHLSHHEREEYIAEGIAIVYRLHQNSWRREQTPSFATYLSTYLTLRLRDYRRSQLCEGGEAHWQNHKVRWVGRESLNQMAEAGEELAAPDIEELAA